MSMGNLSHLVGKIVFLEAFTHVKDLVMNPPPRVHVHTYIYIYIYISMYVFIYIYVL